ncbi:MAG TPA: EVE domain-containing protein [Holophagaceae bacterium]|nr:EVE domain-containing protein [Holophagaceae bacterium]
MRGWLGVVSRSHIRRGVVGGFIQLCHGKPHPLRRMAEGDVLVIYSPRTEMTGGEVLQAFTAFGIVGPNDTVQVEMAPGFRPFRRSVRYLEAREAPIRPLLDRLSFSRGNPAWGQVLRRGQVALTSEDVALLRSAMRIQEG